MQLFQDTEKKALLPERALARNSLINLAGFVLPLAVGLFTIPKIINGFGIERFGLLTLAWAIIGYFSLFDMGLGRAMTQLVAERFGRVPDKDVAILVWTGLLIMSIFALCGTVMTAILAPWIISSVLNVSSALNKEATWAFILLAPAIPAVVLSTGFSGMLAAMQRFDLINILRIPMGMLIFIVPLIVLPYSKSTAHVCVGLMGVRVIFLVLHAAACFYAFPQLLKYLGIDRSVVRKLLTFGGWMTVSNVIGPLMVYVDRFIIGTMLSVSAVAYYVTPYEMVTRLWAIPASIVNVLFPAFAASKTKATDHAKNLYSLGGRAILLVLAPVVLLLVLFAQEGLAIWLGSDFSHKSTAVLQCLVVGVYVNSYAQVPFAFIQGIGRADITAKLHLIEMPVYIILMFWLLDIYGIVGVAVAWMLRVTLDAGLLTLTVRLLAREVVSTNRQIMPILVTPLVLCAIGVMMDQMIEKIAFMAISILILLGVSYLFAITPMERQNIHKALLRTLSS